MNDFKMEVGKMYFIDYGGTQIIGRFLKDETTQYIFSDLLHYWNTSENFQKNNPYCVHTGIMTIREASKAEKLMLFSFEIEHNLV